jgi:hypothetical protein
VEWKVAVECEMSTFLDFTIFKMSEFAPKWDETYVDSICLATHGDASDLSTYARLMQWKFKMPWPFGSREMLYIVVPILLENGATIVSYISVESNRFPLSDGFTRAFNAVPSFDMAHQVNRRNATAKLELRHVMSTRIGGWVSDKFVWNTIFQGPVINNNATEAANVRNFLQSELAS